MTDRIHLSPDAMSRLRSARLALGISQRTLAESAGYSREEVCQWELGRRTVNLTQFQNLAQALGVRLELSFTTAEDGCISVMADDTSESE